MIGIANRFTPHVPFRLATIAIIAVAVGCAFLRPSPRTTPTSHPARVAIPLPKVEPTALADIAPDDARKRNAAIPFVQGPVAPATSWRLAGSVMERERALTCMTAALWWEAGDDTSGQRAVAQVVINRVRHPAFPNSVCGVVFQGSERSTGCQFTFTCDGALARHPSAAAWNRARAVAEAAMNGSVDPRVGYATHYHTDWVVPYWSQTLDKLAKVGTHLFYRWKGWWGTKPAFSGSYSGAEEVDLRIAALTRPEAGLQELADAAALAGATSATDQSMPDGLPGMRASDLVLSLNARDAPETYAKRALAKCAGQRVCTVMGWTNPDRVPKTTPVTTAMKRSMSFLYRRNPGLGHELVLWNCMQIKRDDPAQCIPGTEPDPHAPPS